MLKFRSVASTFEERAGKTLVLGVGNVIRGDDAVGIYVARRVKEKLPPELAARVDVEEACTGGFDLVDYLRGYDRVVIADAIRTDGGKPGTVYKFSAGALEPTAHLGHTHGVNLASALAVLEELKLGAPREVTVVAVEAEWLYEFKEGLSARVAAAVGEAAAAVLEILNNPKV
ncbi:MAG: hydrogenase maturation protease [candidate division Zixibacteria bacterium]|nr:hydrogenase maturation protease [candidate division Zixibacteria bacterium]